MASSSASPPPPPPPPWVDLPQEITSVILQKLGSVELLTTAQRVCKKWRKICKEPAMWRVIDMRYTIDFPYDMDKMCFHAVDLSQGQLIDLNIEFFGSDDLLRYIAQRSGQLRRLRIVSGFYLLRVPMYGRGLADVAKKFPLLEELHLFFWRYMDDEYIEDIGNSCPLLRSFTFNKHSSRYPVVMDNDALAIATFMPKLRHLQLYANLLSNKGLVAILDGCPELESLDLRKCLYVNLEGELGTRCFKQIKNLRAPNDDPKDYEYYSGPSDSDESSYESSPYGLSDMDLMSEDSGSENVYAFSDMEGEDSGDE